MIVQPVVEPMDSFTALLETAHFPVYTSTSELHIAKPQIIILWGHKIVRVNIFENNY